MKEIKRYFAYMGEYRRRYWTILTITLFLEAFLEISYSYINKQILNAVEYNDMERFRFALFLCFGVVIMRCVFPYLRYFQIKLVRNMVFTVKIRLFQKLMRLDMEWFVKNHSGEALKTLNWDANSLKDSWFSHVYWVLGKITLGIASLTAMFVYNPGLAVISIVFCALTAAVSVKLNDEIKKCAKAVQNSTAVLADYFSDILRGFFVLKMYEGSSIVLENFYGENEKVTRKKKQRTEKTARLEAAGFLLGMLGSFGTIAAGVFLCRRGEMDYGTVMAVVTLQMNVQSVMQRLGSSIATFSTSLVKVGRVFDFLELTCEEEENSGQTAQLDFGKSPVKISDLTFSYGEGKILEDFCIDIRPKEKVVIRGESGRGKSTLLKLLLRFYPIASGRIWIYGKDINTYSLWQLRNRITYIPQNSYLFEGTVAENIGYGKNGSSEAAEDEIVNAAKLAFADEFIRQLPDGYNTVIEAGGNNLSGGQRQRIAIARAFLKDAPILLMDEPSSALDIESEQRIYEAVRKLMKDRVVFMVTHKGIGIDDFDRVVEL
ncbi:MAG: ABC transporter ATP-binding protein/permease [Alistipes sp.]|nr:ABC transporter ATP-binding protein/permease [Alistipes sp.]